MRIQIRRKNLIQEIFLYTIAILYLVDIRFYFFPDFIRARSLIGFIGILLFIFEIGNNGGKINKYVIGNILWLILPLLPFFATTLVNGHIDFWGFRPFLNVVVMFAAYLVAHIFQRGSSGKSTDDGFDSIVKFIIKVIIINIIISIFIFYTPELKRAVFLLQGEETNNTFRNYYASNFRLYGLGNFFFYQGGLYCSWCLILLAYIIKRSSKQNKFVYFSLYVFTLISGFFMARTIMVGFIFSLLYFLLPEKLRGDVIIKLIARILFFGTILLLITFPLVPYVKNWLVSHSDNQTIGHAFEFFINFAETGRFESESTNHLQTMYIFPDSMKTWIFGDGIFSNPDKSYYMNTDVGYLRLIFFFGTVGLTVFILQKIYILKTVKTNGALNTKRVELLVIIYLFTFTIMLKGFADFDPILFLIFWMVTMQKNCRSCIKNNNHKMYGAINQHN